MSYNQHMQKYYFVKLNDLSTLINGIPLDQYAIQYCNSTGVQNFSLDEVSVDAILGERSYSGADLPLEVIEEVEALTEANSEATYHVFFNSLIDAKCFTAELDKMHIDFEIESADIADWNDEWKKNFSPIKFEQEFEIIPSWYTDYKSDANKKILVYPGMGFGTGSHETTYLCIKLYLEKLHEIKKNSCMDYGCGSGILGLIYKIYNKKALIDLYDIDQAALDNCAQNRDLNHIDQEQIKLLLPKDRDKFQVGYDLVFANILKNILLDEGEQILKLVNKGGHLIVSGLLQGQQQEIINNYIGIDPNLELEKEIIKGDWVALRFIKKV